MLFIAWMCENIKEMIVIYLSDPYTFCQHKVSSLSYLGCSFWLNKHTLCFNAQFYHTIENILGSFKSWDMMESSGMGWYTDFPACSLLFSSVGGSKNKRRIWWGYMTLFFNLLALQQVLQVKLLHMTVLLINMHNLCFCTKRQEKEEVCCFSHSGKSCLICVNRVIEVNIYLITNLKIACRQKDYM